MIVLNVLFLCLALIVKIMAQGQEHKILKLDVQDIAEIKEDMGMLYYKLTIPQNSQGYDFNLAIRIKENDLADEGKDDFSDPDIYVSKTNQYPNNPQNSNYYSERYGEDLLSIPKSEVKENEVFYIGVFCQRKCKFEILARLEPEFEIQDGVMYHTTITKENSVSFKFQARSTDYEEMQIVAFSEQMGYFRIYANKNVLPSPQKTILAIPSWAGGYTIDITKGTQDYCTNCPYYIVIEAPVYDVVVSFFVKYEENTTNVSSAQPIFSALKPYRQHCYSIFIDDSNINENLIIQTELFMGSARLLIKPWSLPDMTSNTDEYIIHTERVIKYSPEERRSINNTESGNFFFCLKTTEYTSYIIRAFFESDVEKTQKFSFLYKGKDISGWLPAGKVMRYRIIEFDAKSDINFSLNIKRGDPKLYGYICENIRKCEMTKKIVDDLLSNNKLIKPQQEYTIGYSVQIENSINTCHKNLEKEDSLKNNINNIHCATLAIVVCEGTEECEYTIRTSRETTPFQLQPRKIHYQIIPFNETDIYTINIEDETVDNLVIVLNSISGDADLSVYQFDENEMKLLAISENEPYLPDVIRIDKNKINKSNLKGKYQIKVYGSSFSSYSLYYYYSKTNNTDIKVDPSLISLELQTGHIVKDFFENGTNYKVYAYYPNINSDMDIRITLTPERSQFGIYVFLNPAEIEYQEKENYFDRVKNAKWSSLYQNEIIIRKTDENYQRDAMYYIVITKLFDNNMNKKNHIPAYWLGITNEIYPFLLYEGVPQMSTLDSNYNNQTYWYTHPNISEPFSLSINVFFGRVSIYADFEEIRDHNSTDIPLKALDIDTQLLTIPVETLKKGCKQRNNCGIFIQVVKSSQYDAQYLLVAKSHPNKPEMLTSGVTRTDSMSPGEVRKYNFFVEKKENTIIFVSLLSGYADVYINVPKEYQANKKATYPTNEKFDYQAQDFYLGKVVNLNDKVFEACDPCQIFVSVYGRNLNFDENEIEYSITYYDQARKINQNQPLRGYINQGEFQYFNVYFGQKAENVYVSVTNMDGDVDVFMNHGLLMPTLYNSTWSSSTPYNEFIDFNKDDSYFVTKNSTDVSGNYTIMLYGYTNSTYTLYITSHPNKILPVSSFSPASCRANAKGSCYFLFDDFSDFEYLKEDDEYDFIITTDYLFGSGVIYASLYSDTNYDIIEKFPGPNSNDFNTINTNSRNLLKFKINNKFKTLTKDSMLLVTVECKENCFFDLNMIKMFDSDIQYLDLNRENIFYIYKNQNKKTLLNFYNTKNKDLNYYIYTYEGQADFKVYKNDSLNAITDINNFSVDYKRNSTYHDSISAKQYNINYQSVFFEVNPITDVGFYVKLSYDQEWTKLKTSKTNNILLKPVGGSNQFYGYFDFMDDFEYVVLSATVEDPNALLYVYVRYVYIDKKDKNADEKNPYGYMIPDRTNAELLGKTDSILNSVSLKIKRPTLDNLKGKFIRVLLTVEMVNLNFARDFNNTKVDIMVSPSTSGMTKVEAEQDKYIFSQFQGINTDTKIYDLKRRMPEDDLLVIEISNCVGDVDYKITERMNFNQNDITSIIHEVNISSGRKLIKVNLSKYTGDNFYLTLLPKSGGQRDCYIKNGQYTCDDNLISMFYYYTTTESDYKNSFANGRGSIIINDVDSDSVNLKWNKILQMDDKHQINAARTNYTLFVSENLFDFNHMESVCYLSKLNMNNTKDYHIEEKEDAVYANILGLTHDKRYFINVLAKNIDTNEILAYQPIEVIPKKGSIPTFYIFVIIFTILILLVLVYYFYRRFHITREILKYETSDVRNMSNVPRSESELRDLAKNSDLQKYANLTSEISSV